MIYVYVHVIILRYNISFLTLNVEAHTAYNCYYGNVPAKYAIIFSTSKLFNKNMQRAIQVVTCG